MDNTGDGNISFVPTGCFAFNPLSNFRHSSLMLMVRMDVNIVFFDSIVIISLSMGELQVK